MPVPEKSIDHAISKIEELEYADYLFFAWQTQSCLSDLSSVYSINSYANLMWRTRIGATKLPVVALFFHVVDATACQPIGSVTLLDYTAIATDIYKSSILPEPDRMQHIFELIHQWTRVRQCSIMEVIEYLKTGR